MRGELERACRGRRAEEQAIRALDDRWNAATAKKDVEANVDMYAPDGATLWPNAPIGKGTTANPRGWTEVLEASNRSSCSYPTGQGGVRR